MLNESRKKKTDFLGSCTALGGPLHIICWQFFTVRRMQERQHGTHGKHFSPVIQPAAWTTSIVEITVLPLSDIVAPVLTLNYSLP